MKIISPYLLILFSIFFLNSCADVGNKSLKDINSAQVQATLTEGVTTKNQVEAIFGSPIETTYTDSGALIFKYQYDDTTAFTPETVGSVLLTWGLAGTKSKGTRNELVVLFDENEIVKKFNMSNSKIEAGTMIFAD